MARKKGLSRAKVLTAAVKLVDEAGLGALSMRRLGEALGVEAMSLYRHVRNKSDVLDGVHAHILGTMRVPPGDAAWTARLGALAREFRAVLQRHPNALPLFATRPAVAQASLGLVDRALGILAEAGFSPADQLTILHSLVSFTIGTCLGEASWNDPERPQVDYASLDPERFPNLCRLAPAIAVEDADYEFDTGLAALLRGFEALLG